MRIIVNNEAEAELMKKFLLTVHELCIIDLMEQEDGNQKEDQCLNTDDYRILNEAVFNDQVEIEVDKEEPELFFEETEFVEGTCIHCKTVTTGLTDPDTLTYADYLNMMTLEAMNTWRCETCQIKHRNDDQN